MGITSVSGERRGDEDQRMLLNCWRNSTSITGDLERGKEKEKEKREKEKAMQFNG
jgi:hypothetical protein